MIVQDNEDPIVTVGTNITANTGDDGGTDCTVALTVPDVTTTDNCSVSGLSWELKGVTTGSGSDQVGLQTYNLGLTWVVYTVTDPAGNTAKDSISVTVLDDQDPIVTVGTNITANTGDDGGTDCTVALTVPDVTTTDNCSVSGLSWELKGVTTGSGSDQVGLQTYNLGLTWVVYTVTDPAGNTAKDSISVTVLDDQDPIVTVGTNITANTGDDGGTDCTVALTVPDVTTTDNCSVSGLSWELKGVTTGSGSDQVGLQTYNLGLTWVVYTVTDPAGNTAKDSISVTVLDDQDPIVTVGTNITANTGDDGGTDCTVALTVPDVTTTDNCSVSGLSWELKGVTTGSGSDQVGLQTYNLGLTWVVYTVTDPAGNTAKDSISVTVLDDQDPIVTVGTNITANTGDDGGTDCTVALTVPDVTTTDNCSVSGLSWELKGVTTGSGSDQVGLQTYNLGLTWVVYTVTDPAGNTAKDSISVTVLDDQDPIVTVGTNITANTGDDGGTDCTVALTVPDVTTTDNCSVSGLSWELKGVTTGSGSDQVGLQTYNLGLTWVVYTVTDPAGNTAKDSISVTVLDDQDPIVTVGTNITANTGDDGGTDCTVALTVPDVTTTDNCSVSGLSWELKGVTTGSGSDQVGLQTYNLGLTWVVYTVTDPAGNTAKDSISVTVLDDQDPIVTVGTNITANTGDDGGTDCTVALTVPDVTTTDNCSVSGLSWELKGVTTGSGSDQVGLQTYNLGLTWVVYTVSDPAGNTAKDSISVTVLDDQDPIVTVGTNITANTGDDGGTDCTVALTVPDVTTSDNCSVSGLTWELKGVTTGSGSDQVGLQTYNLGLTWVVYTVSDPAGNTAKDSISVTVLDDQDPIVTVGTNITANTGDDGGTDCTVALTVPDVTTSDNCSVSGLTWELKGVTTGSGSDQVGLQTYNLGLTWVVYTVSDPAGNTAKDSISVTVLDDQDPIVTVGTNITANTGDDGGTDCTVALTVPDVTTSDNCSVSGLTWELKGVTTGSGSDQVGLQTYNLGLTWVVYTVTDPAGNTAQDSISVTVLDDQAPQFTVPPSDTVCRAIDCSYDIDPVLLEM